MIKTFTFTSAEPSKWFLHFKMDLDENFPADKHLINQGIYYDEDVSHVLVRTLKPGDHAVDAGACVGYFTLVMQQIVGDTGKVFAIEPAAANREKLAKSRKLNGTTDKIVVCANPLWSKEEEVDFYLSADDSGGNALWDPGKWRENTKSREHINIERLPATTLDMLIEEPWKLKVLKLDVEGAEQHVLQGFSRGLRSGVPYIICELNWFGLEQMGHSQDSLREFMHESGYETFLLYRDGQMPKLVPHNARINQRHIINILFSTPEAVGLAWPEAQHAT